MFPAGLLLMARIVRKGPEAVAGDTPVRGGRPGQPIEALGGPDEGDRP
jgi:hypothetical protein